MSNSYVLISNWNLNISITCKSLWELLTKKWIANFVPDEHWKKIPLLHSILLIFVVAIKKVKKNLILARFKIYDLNLQTFEILILNIISSEISEFLSINLKFIFKPYKISFIIKINNHQLQTNDKIDIQAACCCHRLVTHFISTFFTLSLLTRIKLLSSQITMCGI